MMSRHSTGSIEEVLGEQTERLLAIPGVVGTAQGLSGGKPCLLVYVADDASDVARKIPGTLCGYPVRVEKTGEIQARPGPTPMEDAQDEAGPARSGKR
jgi:hypothetical protein